MYEQSPYATDDAIRSLSLAERREHQDWRLMDWLMADWPRPAWEAN